MPSSSDIEPLLVNWWAERGASSARLDAAGLGNSGANARNARHMQSIAAFVRQMFIDAGLEESEVTLDRVIPGYYRRSKNWDVVAIHKGHLVGVVELKSQEKSPSNNANNRIEEAIGSAHDALAVQEISEAFGKLGVWAAWGMTFNRDCEPVRRNTPKSHNFPLDLAFVPFTYARQYSIAIERMVARNVYQAGWMVETWLNPDQTVGFDEPVPSATADTLRTLIHGRVQFALTALA
ncbi:PaeR7I family type II restriction endonuclease [Leifsonia sp. RAF41]|uniref:PaeR7I family type II restriction endonuclease n=1 Tax=Leifsonia sp. RAF41 TaxID=3233056 RepID=UPI003F9E12D6